MNVQRMRHLRYRHRPRMRYSGKEYESWLTAQQSRFSGVVNQDVLDTQLRRGATPEMIQSTYPVLYAFEPGDVTVSGTPKVGEMIHGKLAPYLNEWPPLNTFKTNFWNIVDMSPPGQILGDTLVVDTFEADMQIPSSAATLNIGMRINVNGDWQGNFALRSTNQIGPVEN